MTFTNQLKGQLTDFADIYKKYFLRTFGATLTLTIICFVGAAFLLRFSDFDEHVLARQISILSYFFHRYSKSDTYCLVDLTKTIFIFFLAIFSVGLTRLINTEIESKELSFFQFLRKINFKDIFYFIGILLIASLIDFAFFKLDSYSAIHSSNKSTATYIHDWVFSLRIYVPLILFALTIRSLTITEKTKLTLKRILYLFISLWLFNEFAYEISMWIRAHIFGLILLPVEDPNKYYLFESFLSIPLIAFYFLGYHSAMTTSLKQTE